MSRGLGDVYKRQEYARYSEDGEINATNLRRLVQKFKTASELVPDPEIILSDKKNCSGVIYYGSTSAAMIEARDMLKEEGIETSTIPWIEDKEN